MFCSGVSVLHHCFLTSPHLGPGRSWTLSPLKAVELRKPRFSELDVNGHPSLGGPGWLRCLSFALMPKGLVWCQIYGKAMFKNHHASNEYLMISNDILLYIFFFPAMFLAHMFSVGLQLKSMSWNRPRSAVLFLNIIAVYESRLQMMLPWISELLNPSKGAKNVQKIRKLPGWYCADLPHVPWKINT